MQLTSLEPKSSKLQCYVNGGDIDLWWLQVKCKMALQKELGLPIRPDCPMVWFQKPNNSLLFCLIVRLIVDCVESFIQIGFIGRLDYQKGIDLIQAAGHDLMVDDIQFVSESFFLTILVERKVTAAVIYTFCHALSYFLHRSCLVQVIQNVKAGWEVWRKHTKTNSAVGLGSMFPSLIASLPGKLTIDYLSSLESVYNQILDNYDWNLLDNS